MPHELLYTLLGIALSALTLLITVLLGWVQIKIGKREESLNVAKAAPKIGTSVLFEERQNPHHLVSTLVIITRIYNEGDMAVSNVKGCWNLTCSQSDLSCSFPISIDHLGNSRPFQQETPFGGVGTWMTVKNGVKNIAIEVDLELMWTIHGEKNEKSVLITDTSKFKRDRYEYSPEQRNFIKVTQDRN